MPTTRNRTLRAKLFILLSGCSLTTALIVGGLFVNLDYHTLRSQAAEHLDLKAQWLVQLAAAALTESEEESESRLRPGFQTLLHDRHLLAVAVYGPDGTMLLYGTQPHYRESFAPPAIHAEEIVFAGDHNDIFRTVKAGERILGTIFLRHDTTEFQARYHEFIRNGMAIIAVAFCISVLLASWYGRTILRPVVALSRLANRVGKERNYSLRATQTSNDEIGNLVRCFNDMLGQVEQSDKQLRQSQDELEERVDERTRALQAKQDELKTSERRFRTLFEGSADAILLMVENRLVDCNSAALNLFGIASREDLADLPIAKLSPPRQSDGRDSATAAAARLEEAKRLGSTRFQWTHRRCDGHDFPCDVLLTALKLGDHTLIQGVVRDISIQKAAETEILTARDNAERSNHAKSEFLSRMSHELRTPLNSILGFSELMIMSRLPEPHTENARHINEAGKHLLDLINEVLDISRIESGNLNLAADEIDLNAMIADVASMVRPIASRRRIEVTAELHTDSDVFVSADCQRLRQVLLNLASNGIKYNREGGKLMLSLAYTDCGCASIAVRDTGIGIPTGKLTRLFTPFDRLDAERSQSEIEGTGLGLALTHKLLEAMDGRITVASTEGEGSTFTVELPAVHCHWPRNPASTTRTNGAATTADDPAGNSGSLLYIEDNRTNLMLVRQIMKRRPRVHLLTATDGQEGLRVARQSRPNLVLLDYHLPDLNGDEVLQRIKADTDTLNIPVYMLTADAMTQNAQRLKTLGADDYLTKPLDVKAFLEMVDRHFSA